MGTGTAAAAGKVFVNSGNLRNPRAKPGEWILDETVWVINDLAESLVRSDPQLRAVPRGARRPGADAAHHAHRDRVFLQPRPLEYYTDALTRNGLTVTDVDQATIVAEVDEWFELMTAYHDAVLGWVGGTQALEGAGAQRATRCRTVSRSCATRSTRSSAGAETFNACWTYITAEKAV